MSYYEPKIFAYLMMVTSVLSAIGYPVMGFLITRVYFSLMAATYDPAKLDDLDLWLIYYGIFVISFGFLKGSEQAMYGVAGEHLTTNVRSELMEGIIYKQLSWFDSETKAPGMLTNIMAEDMSALNGMTTETISVLVQGCLGMGLAVIMSSYFSWRTTLLTLAASPILMIGVYGMSRLQWGNKGGSGSIGTKESDDYAKANALLSDSIMNYKTVISFG